MKKSFLLIHTVIFLLLAVTIYPCTIGVIRAELTETGKPMLWKIRDTGSENSTNYPIYDYTGLYGYVAFTHTTNYQQTWAGVNEVGFAMLNALSLDLHTNGLDNGLIITHAIQNFATIWEWESYLDATNGTSRRTAGNFAVMDAIGNVAMYELSNVAWYKYDVYDSPDGFIIRTNFSMVGDGTNGRERFARSENIISQLVAGDNFSVESLLAQHLRDFSDTQSHPFTIPYLDYTDGHFGYINYHHSISNNNSTGAVIITGMTDSADIPIMWTIAGFPVVTPMLPFIVPPSSIVPPIFHSMQNTIQIESDISRIPVLSQTLRRSLANTGNPHLINTLHFIKENQSGIWDRLSDFEHIVMDDFYHLMASHDFLDTYPGWISSYIDRAYKLLQTITSDSDETIHRLTYRTLYTYPNPTTGAFKIISDISQFTVPQMEIYNIKGQKVFSDRYVENIEITLDKELPNGVYLIRIWDSIDEVVGKMVILR
jgi:hypothetical protein